VQVLERAAQLEAQGTGDQGMELVLLRVTKLPYYNRSRLTFPQVLDDPPEEPAFEHVSLTPSVEGRRASELRS
jgi:hypothetical protein